MAEWRVALRTLFARRVVLIALVLLALMLLMAAISQWVLPHDPMAMKVSQRLRAPNWSHWSGTDELGRDITSRIFYGARYSLAIGAGTVASLWTERWQFLSAGAVLVGLSLVVWSRPRP